MKKHGFLFLFILAVILTSCTRYRSIDSVQKELANYPEYSIILEDMKEEGNFFTDYYHRYKVVYGEQVSGVDSLIYNSNLTDWQQVSKQEFQDNYNYLGMALISKSGEEDINKNPSPPGYQYVGNARYGQWRQDSQGNSFWEFYGKWMFFSHMFGAFTRPIYRTDWNTYRDYRSSGRPYYGRNNQYGTQGTYTKQTNRSFFERRTAREAARKSRFSQRVNSRTRRSGMSSFRGRSGGFGK